jgi:ribonucleotide reductase alpha subunit
VLAGLGTKTKQFSSCVLLRTDDTLKSIFATGQIMADYASKRAGIGLEIGRMRPLGSSIRGGEVMHTGILPFLKKWYGDLRSCCVTPDTWVEVDSGRIQIKDLQIGMKIKTLDSNKQIVYKTVSDKFDTQVAKQSQIQLTFENGSIINCSTNHPIMIWNNGKIEQRLPEQLTESDRILTEDGFTRLLTIDVGQDNPENYIDITVEDTHTFFASASNDGPMVLTHNSQGGIRNASATINMPIWHYQFDDYIVLKNNKGTEENRIRQLDYCVVLNSFFWRRFKEQKNITFFDPNQVPDLYEAFYADSAKFEKMYEEYEQRKDISKKVESAEVVFKEWLIAERMETGRIYILNIDNVSNQGPFDTNVHPIYQTNLCCEVMLSTKSFQTIDDPDGRIALCTLGSNNWGTFRHPEDMRRPLRLLHRFLHNILQYQDFLSIHSFMHNKEFEPLGVGVTNLAYWHAKRKLKYGDPEALSEVKRWMEHQAFYLTEMNVDLAKEKGKCLESDNTWYGRGVFPWERRAEGVNELADFTPSEDLDWEGLREKMKTYGVRNATTGAIAPVESSSVCINSTNGINLVKEMIVTKRSKGGDIIQVVPEYKRLKNHYQLLWAQKDCLGYLKTSAVLQVYIDQGISTDMPFTPRNYPNGKIDINDVIKAHMLFHKWGGKSLYYAIIEKQAAMESVKDEVKSLPVQEDDGEQYCESCVL